MNKNIYDEALIICGDTEKEFQVVRLINNKFRILWIGYDVETAKLAKRMYCDGYHDGKTEKQENEQ